MSDDEVTSKDALLLLLVGSLLSLELCHLGLALWSGKWDLPLERVGHVSALVEAFGILGMFFRRPVLDGDRFWDVATISFAGGLVGSLPHLCQWILFRSLKAYYLAVFRPHAWPTHLSLLIHLVHVASESSPAYRSLTTFAALSCASWRFSLAEAETRCIVYLVLVSGALALFSTAVKRPQALPSWLQPTTIGAGVGVALGFLVARWAFDTATALAWQGWASKSRATLGLLAAHAGLAAWRLRDGPGALVAIVAAVDGLAFVIFGERLFQLALVLASIGVLRSSTR